MRSILLALALFTTPLMAGERLNFICTRIEGTDTYLWWALDAYKFDGRSMGDGAIWFRSGVAPTAARARLVEWVIQGPLFSTRDQARLDREVENGFPCPRPEPETTLRLR